ncbi:hypothetical protein QUC31_020533 [Theobroma cacao]|uniref:Bromodomain-containing protein DDB_G0278469 n=2 Tax=Theobroma cacao TaxID=3641 RepID=A0AB32UP27_THECC|nr:PREDICTED: bromodomain-containing protein DDB_G0278469 [Theobroma cacao]EOY29905.1 Uncharacterized protein TCM_037289 [Theobroma cacao]
MALTLHSWLPPSSSLFIFSSLCPSIVVVLFLFFSLGKKQEKQAMLEESMSTAGPSIWASIFSWFTPTVFFVFLNLTIGTIYLTSSLASNKPGVGEGQRQEGEETPKLVRHPSVLQRLKSINLSPYRSQEPVSTTVTAYERIPDVDDAHFSFQQQTPEQDQRQQQPSIFRSPSVLQRLKSVNLYSYLSPERTTVHKNQEIYTHYTPAQAREEEEEQQKQESEEEQENQGGLKEEVIEEEEERIQGQERTLDEIFSQLKDGHVRRTKSDTKPSSGEIPTKLPKNMRKSASVKSAFSHFEEEDIVETRRPATVREGKAKATEEDEEVDAKADDFINKFKQQLKLQRIDSILRYKETVNRGSGR